MSISERKHVSEGEAPARRIEIFTGAGRRRSWSAREKAAIVAESFEEGVPVCHVARRHGLTPQQLFAWRREARCRIEVARQCAGLRSGVVEATSTLHHPISTPQTKRATRARTRSSWTSTVRACGSGPAPRWRW